MITVIAGTNRNDSRTIQIANFYMEILAEKNIPATLLDLNKVDVTSRTEDFQTLEQELLIPSDKFIFIMPEYNGSFPGILKLMMDNSDIRKVWWHKKALLTGVAIGRGGNLRGLDHMSGILHYLKVNVHYNKLPLSLIHEHMDTEGMFNNQPIQDIIRSQVEEFIAY